MGLALNEVDREARAIEFYNVLSTFDFMSLDADAVQLRHAPLAALLAATSPPSTTISTASTRRSRKTRCSPSGPAASATTGPTCAARLAHQGHQRQVARASSRSSRCINDTAVAVNQGGKRKGAGCAYLETWHHDIEEFLELRKNTGDDRRRTHDMNTANWIPDLFMKRVWRAASGRCSRPSDVPGPARHLRPQVRGAYTRYEEQAAQRRAQAATRRSRPSSSGGRCSRCSSRPAIRGSPSRTPATCARRRSTSASCTAPTSAPRSRSTPAITRSPSATSARSTCSTT